MTIIILWVISMITLIIIMGEVRYRRSYIEQTSHKNVTISNSWKDDIDNNIEQLNIERLDSDFVSRNTLAMRGSWRLAQNQVIDNKTLSALLEEEYSQRLS